MKSLPTFAFQSLAGLLIGSLWISGCENPREDVRLTLCKDMVAVRLGASAPFTWKGSETKLRGRDHAAVRVDFLTQNGDGQAVCYYPYDSVDDTALNLSEPISAYGTSPVRMTINGQDLSRQALAETIKDAMLKQGSDLIGRAKQGFN